MFSVKYLVIFIITLAIILIVFSYFHFRVKSCSNIDCFNSAMEKCKRASFINEGEDASWLYTIDSKEGSFGCFIIPSKCSSCIINVKILQVKEGTVDTQAVEGLDMECSVVLGYIGVPNADLNKCHGDLREGLQDLMIKKMHAYILANVGQIGIDLNKGL